MSDVEAQNGKAWAEGEEEEIAMVECRAEEVDPSSKDHSDSSYVFVSVSPPTTAHPDPYPYHNLDIDAPPPDHHNSPASDPQPHANHELHSPETTALSSGVQDGTFGIASEQSPFDYVDSPSMRIVDDEGKAEVEPPLPSTEVTDSQISSVNDAQPYPNLGEEGEQQLPPSLQDAVSAEDPQTEPGLDSSLDPDVPPPLIKTKVRLDAAADTLSQILDASALVSDLHAGPGNHLVDSNGGTSEQSLSLEVESPTSSDFKTVRCYPIAHEDGTPEFATNKTSVVADGNMVEVISVKIDSVQESVQLPGISREALPDLPQATPSESQLPVVVETLPSAANHEGAYVLSQENNSPVRALEQGFLDEDYVLAEEVEETTIGMDAGDFSSKDSHLDEDPILAEEVKETSKGIDAGDSTSKDSHLDEDTVLVEEVEETSIGTDAGDSTSKDSHLPEDKEVHKEPVHADVVECCPTNGMAFGTIPAIISSKVVSRGNVGECSGRFNMNNPDGHTSKGIDAGDSTSKDSHLDEDTVLVEEVEETSIGTDAGDSSSKDSHLPEDKEVHKEPVHADVVECCPTNGMAFGTIPAIISSKVVSRGNVGECSGRFNMNNPDGHTSAVDSTDGHSGETNSSKEVEANSVVPVSLTATTEDMQSQDVHVSESEILDKSMNSSENTLANPDIQSGGDQNARVDSLNKTCEENGTNGLHMEETPASSLEGSSSDGNDGQNATSDVVRRPFYYMVKVPYFEDHSLRDQIKDAELRVAEKTEIRDAIQAQRKIPREKQRECANIIKAAKAARGSLSAKHREIDSLNLVIDKTKVASQVDDVDAQIRNMEHSMQHETLSLKEEKQRIRDIKQLKLEREQLSNKMASQVEVQQAFDQKDQAEERLKLLKKEANLLRENFIKADADSKVALQKFDEEQKKLDELDDHYMSANATRQEAYAHLQSLKKQFFDKRRFFSQFKADSGRAKTLALNKDWQGLEDHYDNQVNRLMELWNNDDEFRKDYMRCNLKNTIWRFGTLDGRSLGPGEEPPLIPTFNERMAKLNTVILESTVVEVERSVPCVVTRTGVAKSPEKVGDKNMASKAKDVVRQTVVDTNTVSGADEIIEQASEEDHKLTKEEEEMAKMAEELRKKGEEARLKEQRKMEEKAKAIEAMERKKRNAERAQARAVAKAQKEAELKEKEREKKARKKEKKKAAPTEDSDLVVVGDSSSCSTEASSSEAKKSEATENPVAVVSKRPPQKGKQFTKQSKPKSSIPPPLRNRGRRRMQTWMWVVIVAMVVALFVVGNISSFSLSSWFDGVGGF